MITGEDGVGVTFNLAFEPWAHEPLVKKCDPPPGATDLAEFVRAEAGEELSALRPAFEALSTAQGSKEVLRAADDFAAAVQGFHERARRRLLTGEVVAFGRLPVQWGEYVLIPQDEWRHLVWGHEGDFHGMAGIIKIHNWQPSPAGAWKIGFVEGVGSIELPGGASPLTELAFTWMTSLHLDEVALGACPRPLGASGSRVLGLGFAVPLQQLVRCLVADAVSISTEEACTGWLRTKIAAGPKQQSKSKYRDEALSRWPGLSWRAFDRIWGEATQGAKGWGEPGRPRK